jgi:SAM-dependent methyltransferase
MGNTGTNLDADLRWACPACEAEIASATEPYECSACRRSWPVIDGIPHFVADAPYWGEIPEPQMAALLNDMQRRHWKTALRSSDDPAVVRAALFIQNQSRANWQYLLPAGQAHSALCVGEGMGTTAQALAGNYRTVVAMEPVGLRVEFMRRRFEQDAVRNIRVIRASFPHVPFAKHSFDLVVFNGVLEWLPSSDPARDPYAVQCGALRKAFDLLKPGGHVYVGIENRWCFEYFLGANDPHVGVPWVTILPRAIANRVMKRVAGRRYDTYLYGSRGYRRLLKQAGFAASDVFVAKPSYNEPESLVPIAGHAAGTVAKYFFDAIDAQPRSRIRRIIHYLASRLNLLGEIQYAFAVIGRKT